MWLFLVAATLLANDSTTETSDQTNSQSLSQVAMQWNFDRTDTDDGDWPRGWKRIISRQFPKYLPIAIVPHNTEIESAALSSAELLGRWYLSYRQRKLPSEVLLEGVPSEVTHALDQIVDRCLEVRLDGGAAMIVSPEFPIDPRFLYTVQLICSTNGLDSHIAWAELDLMDESGNSLRVLRSEELSGTRPWTHLLIQPPNDSITRQAARGLVRLGVTSDQIDSLTGSARFDRIRVWKRPRIELSTGRNVSIFSAGEPIAITCSATGLPTKETAIRFTVLDYSGKALTGQDAILQKKVEIEPKTRLPKRSSATYLTTKNNSSSIESTDGEAIMDGTATWQLPDLGPGYYRIRVELGGGPANHLTRDLAVAVLNEHEFVGGGPFGWSLSSDQNLLSITQLPQICQMAGLGWIKLPVWYAPEDRQAADETAWVVERLQSLGVRCVGVLDQPPQTVRSKFPGRGTLSAAQIFQDPDTWQPLLDPVLTRVSLNVSQFQLGSDSDLSMQGHTNLAEKISDVRKRLQGFGQDIRIGLPWNWLDFDPASGKACDFVTLSATPSLTSAELEEYLSLIENSEHANWVAIDPLPAKRYRLSDRIRDLAERMMVIRKNRIEASFVRKPIDEEKGLLRIDGSPTEIFLPWRTLSTNLASAEFLGSITTPGSSTNYVFRRGREAVMVMWNDKTTTERIYLGDEVRCWDMWGREIEINNITVNGATEQEINVGAEPILLTGVHLPVAYWRLSFNFASQTINADTTAAQWLKASFENGFEQGVRGQMLIRSDELLIGGVSSTRFDLTAGAPGQVELPLRLRPDASTGEQRVSIEFEVEADHPYRFKVYRPLQIGSKDIEVELSCELDANGNLVVREDMINNTDKPASFDCTLFVPGRSHQRLQILGALPGRTTRRFVLPNGSELVGETVWLRCEQLGTNRFLNFRLAIKL